MSGNKLCVTDSNKVIDENISTYIHYSQSCLSVWRSLSRKSWYQLAKVTLTDWDKMYAGWPDITIHSPSEGLSLVELKLKEVLGPNRIAIALVGNSWLPSSGMLYQAHTQETINWLNNNLEQSCLEYGQFPELKSHPQMQSNIDSDSVIDTN